MLPSEHDRSVTGLALAAVTTTASASLMGRRTRAPQAPLSRIVRPRLISLLGERFSHPLTTVVAGAGFGKTTALAQAVRANLASPPGSTRGCRVRPQTRIHAGSLRRSCRR